MNKKFFSIISISVFIIIIIGVIFLISSNKKEENLNEKIEEELSFIGKELINMINSLNNIKFDNFSLEVNKEISSEGKKQENNKSEEDKNSEKEQDMNSDNTDENKKSFSQEEKSILNTDMNDIDWNYLKNNSERIYNIWITSIIDLNSLNVNNEDILSFSNVLDMTTISAKNEDKTNLLSNLTILYSYIPNFLTQIESDNKKIQISNTIYSVLNSYAFVNENNWEDAELSIEEAISSYLQIINNVDENSKYSKNKITRIYVLLNELRNSTNLKNKDIYFIKYKNVIEELINL